MNKRLFGLLILLSLPWCIESFSWVRGIVSYLGFDEDSFSTVGECVSALKETRRLHENERTSASIQDTLDVLVAMAKQQSLLGDMTYDEVLNIKASQIKKETMVIRGLSRHLLVIFVIRKMLLLAARFYRKDSLLVKTVSRLVGRDRYTIGAAVIPPVIATVWFFVSGEQFLDVLSTFIADLIRPWIIVNLSSIPAQHAAELISLCFVAFVLGVLVELAGAVPMYFVDRESIKTDSDATITCACSLFCWLFLPFNECRNRNNDKDNDNNTTVPNTTSSTDTEELTAEQLDDLADEQEGFTRQLQPGAASVDK
jgi:hypothetical protein